MTAEGLAGLRDEVERLRTEKAREVARRLRDARAFGDATANDEQWAIREEEAVLDARIARLEEIISRARVLDDDPLNGHVARLGSVVEIEDSHTGESSRYRVVGGHETFSNGDLPTVSAVSPIGRAIIGQPEGTSVAVELPDGRARELRLARIE